MLGAIAGDVIGSTYERYSVRDVVFPLFPPGSRFTDDTVLTVATAHALLHGTPYADAYHAFGRRHPLAGYGGSFAEWLRRDDRQPYGSWGNGSAMRVGPVGLAARSVEDALAEAARSARATHDHPEGVLGAQAVALAVHLAARGTTKGDISAAVARHTGYDLARTVEAIRPGYRFDVSCRGSVPEAIIAFLESNSFEDAVRLAVSLGGDADTQAAIAGSIAEPFYGGVPDPIARRVRGMLTPDLLAVVDAFQARFPAP